MLFWGTAFRASVIAAEHAPPVMITGVRAGVAAAVLVLVAVALRSRLPPREFWLLTVVTGLLMVTLAGDFVLGVGLSIAGAMGWAVGVLLTKTAFIRKPDIDMVGLTMGHYVIGGGAALALAFLLEGGATTEWSSTDFWGAIAWIAIGGSVIATLAYFGALKRMSATTVMAWQFLVPVVAVLTRSSTATPRAPSSSSAWESPSPASLL